MKVNNFEVSPHFINLITNPKIMIFIMHLKYIGDIVQATDSLSRFKWISIHFGL